MRATLPSVCPHDCPSQCALQVTVEAGRITDVTGDPGHPFTRGVICGKVHDYAERVYGPTRVRTPLRRVGPKGEGRFEPIGWGEAVDEIAHRWRRVIAQWGGEAILPFSYGGSNGLLSQDTQDAELWRKLGTSRLDRTVCAAPTGAAFKALYGKMPGVTYADYAHAKLIVVWGANPSTSGFHLVPVIREAQRRGAALVVIDPRYTQLARLADLYLAIRPGTDLPVALAVHRFLFENGLADMAFLAGHARGVSELRARAADWPTDRAAAEAGIDAEKLDRFARMYAERSPAVIRCGWGLERSRSGGSAAMAVLALPAVGGKFGVRGGGYTMSNSMAWGLRAAMWIQTPEPATRLVNMNHLGRALTEYDRPPVRALFVYNCNPAVTMPDQSRVLRGLARDDLFTVVFDQVLTDTARYADVLLPATTFLEHYDIAKAYGPVSLQLVQPAIDAVGEARSNPDVFSALAARLGFADDADCDAETLIRVTNAMPENIRTGLLEHGIATPPHEGAPVQFVDVFPQTPDGKIDLHSEALAASAPVGLYVYQPDPATDRYPLALISPASSRTISSTLGELREHTAKLEMHPEDASARGLSEGDSVRVFNDLGEVQCELKVTPIVRTGTVSLPKGLWRKSTFNGLTANALAPDTLADLGGGACFNDARVEVASLGRH